MADPTTAASLGAKLDTLDLTADEHSLLTDLLTPADAEVTGYTASFSAMLTGTNLTGLDKIRVGRPAVTSIMPGDNVDN